MARCGLDSHRALEVCVFGIGEGELAIIVVFGFLLFGPDKLPQMGRTIGRAIRQFRETQEKMTAVVQSEIIDPVSEVASAPVKPKKTAATDDDSDADEDVGSARQEGDLCRASRPSCCREGRKRGCC
jgi:TatA/E family protein of Tat protein translocase